MTVVSVGGGQHVFHCRRRSVVKVGSCTPHLDQRRRIELCRAVVFALRADIVEPLIGELGASVACRAFRLRVLEDGIAADRMEQYVGSSAASKLRLTALIHLERGEFAAAVDLDPLDFLEDDVHVGSAILLQLLPVLILQRIRESVVDDQFDDEVRERFLACF